MKRPDDQNWWEKLWRTPSAGQRGWDWGHEFVRDDPSEKDFRDTMHAHEANRCYDPTEFDEQFARVIDYWLTYGHAPEDRPAELEIIVPRLAPPEPFGGIVTYQRIDYDCVICGQPGQTCDINSAYCPHLPEVTR